MFDAQIYSNRRNILKNKFESGLLLILGNEEAPANYTGNPFPFRQDSTFLYYFGIDLPGLAAVIDIDNHVETIYGNDFTVDDIVWMGPQPKVQELALLTEINISHPIAKLEEHINDAVQRGRKIHFLPQYRAELLFKVSDLTGLNYSRINDYASEKLIKAVVDQRSIKSEEEIKEIDAAVDIAYKMHTSSMKMVKPGILEMKIAGMIEGISLSLGSGLSFRPIVSVNGQTLHNHFYGNTMEEGDLLVNDSGAESKLHYASDITRTIPVSGKFSQKQREIYQIVLKAEMEAINSVKPGIMNKDLHIGAAKIIAEGLNDLGLMKGSIDDAVNSGAHGMFFPHGLGHMMGLDVHDMENLGENFVGYDERTERSEQFGLKYLRLAKTLQPGHVFTIEPGIYFIPELIDMWKKQSRHEEFINYDKVEEYQDFGGIRIEDDVLVTEESFRVLGSKPIPKSVEEVETLASS
ncbi:MAG: aminopeptidase P family protein [Ignavibacteriaceae bacterium]|nr:aminopeptidase P family protein [Ignavibacteria bacterium]NNJ53060.1 aminopeptidase P family protein [Ignavibacteriaceae bacterium]